jgi:hypothetical protein
VLKAPWERPNLLSRVSFHWMTSYMRKNPLQLEDILPGIPVNEEREKARLKKKKEKNQEQKMTVSSQSPNVTVSLTSAIDGAIQRRFRAFCAFSRGKS